MDSMLTLYQQRLSPPGATFSRIDHDDAMVAHVYRVSEPDGSDFILKICERPNDYLREVYFLKHFAGKVKVPRLVQEVSPEAGVHGAVLMESLPGTLLTATDFNATLAYELGALLARIHLQRVVGYGDLIQPHDLNADPRFHFNLKFEEGFAECSDHLPKILLAQCRRYYDTHIDLLSYVDGPCIVHRDFRAGNVIVADGKISGVIDWSSARASFAQEDFCPMEHGEWPIHPDSKKSFLAGYAGIRPVPDYSALMPLLRLSRAFATIGFLVKRGTWDGIHASVYQSNRGFLDTFF